MLDSTKKPPLHSQARLKNKLSVAILICQSNTTVNTGGAIPDVFEFVGISHFDVSTTRFELDVFD